MNMNCLPAVSNGLPSSARSFKDWLMDHSQALPFYAIITKDQEVSTGIILGNTGICSRLETHRTDRCCLLHCVATKQVRS